MLLVTKGQTMTTHNYTDSVVVNNFNNEPKRGYIHSDDILPALHQAFAVVMLIGNDCDNNTDDFIANIDTIKNAIWAVTDLLGKTIEITRNA